MRWRFFRFVALSAGFLAAILAAAAFLTWTRESSPLTARPVPPWNQTQPETGNLLGASKPSPDGNEALARPLFSPTRKLFVPAPPEAPAPAPVAEPPPPPEVAQPIEPPQVSLKGVLIAGTTRSALVTTPERPDGIWVSLQQDLSGWIVTSIDKEAITLVNGSQTIPIQLYVDNSGNPLGADPTTR
jgi:hypothetical protein